MFIISLKFGANKARAGEFMTAHRDWIGQGFADGVFLLVGNLEPGQGGAILAHGGSRASIEARIAQDPFVAQGVVNVDLLEITPSRADPRLAFL